MSHRHGRLQPTDVRQACQYIRAHWTSAQRRERRLLAVAKRRELMHRLAAGEDAAEIVDLGGDGIACELVGPLDHVDRIVTLIIPPLAVSTPAAYRAWDDLGGPVADGPNDLEPAALVVEPELRRWRDRIGECVGTAPVLAGSGATWFVDGERANALGELVDDRLGEGADLGNLGNRYADLGEAHQAIEFYEQALAIHREVLESQQSRLMMFEALKRGHHFPWDFQPLRDASEQYTRNHMSVTDRDLKSRFPHAPDIEDKRRR